MIELDRTRLGKLLGMVGSRHDPEALSAARMADELVRRAGLTWSQVLLEPPVVPVLSAPARVPRLSRNEQIELCLGFPDILTDWENIFVSSIARQRRPWTNKQIRVLDRIVNKILGEIGGVQ